ncbi:MAG: 30S ribosomal protein S20 [Clostridia bacterium]|jgi:small subunit ribosomal protein S20|nr:30S ribosomal protein S20 [Clostridia bacterium]MDD4276102.1 30S ribosomal protein S20 [Clostridia bacterium]
MPIIKSAKKRLQVNLRKNLQNRIIKSGIANQIKKFKVAVESKDATLAEKLLPEVFSVLDSAVSSNTIHANHAARNKATLSAKLDTLKISLKI